MMRARLEEANPYSSMLVGEQVAAETITSGTVPNTFLSFIENPIFDASVNPSGGLRASRCPTSL